MRDGWIRRRGPKPPAKREDALEVVPYVSMACHYCGGHELRVYSTRVVPAGRERYHACLSCRRRFRSLERR